MKIDFVFRFRITPNPKPKPPQGKVRLFMRGDRLVAKWADKTEQVLAQLSRN